MFNYNFIRETITNTTQGFWSLFLVISVACIYACINNKVLLSQSGKEDRIAKYEIKQRHRNAADKRKSKADRQRRNYIEECKKHSSKNNNTRKKSTKHIVLNSQAGEEERNKNDRFRNIINFYKRLFKCLCIFVCTYTISLLFNLTVRVMVKAVNDPRIKRRLEKLGIPILADADTAYNYVRAPWKEAKDYFTNCMNSQSGSEPEEYFKDNFTRTKEYCNELFLYIFSFTQIDFDKYYTIFGYIRACSLMQQLHHILDLLVSLEYIECTSIEIRGVNIYSPTRLRNKVKLTDLFDACYALLSSIIDAIKLFPQKGFEAFYGDAINGVFEEDYTYVLSTAMLIDTGKICDKQDIKEFDLRIQRAIDAATSMISANTEKTYYVPKLKELKILHSKRIAAQKDFIRMKPYGILLFGGSSVGKSSIANALTRYVLKINNFRSSADSVVVLNEADKFQSEFRTHHTGVILDDLCNSTVETTEGNPLLKVIQFINNSPQSALNPNAELKGNIMIEPRVVLATTNVKDLNAKHYSNEPLSVARRFDITITQTVKTEFQLSDSAMLDSAKVADAFTGAAYPDFALFTVERPLLHAGNIREGISRHARVSYTPIIFKGKEMINVDLRFLLDYLRESTKKHFSQQRSFVNTQRANVEIELDDEGFPISLSRESDEILDSEFGLLDTILQSYYDLEELIFYRLSNWAYNFASLDVCKNWILEKYFCHFLYYVSLFYILLSMYYGPNFYIYVFLVVTVKSHRWLLHKIACLYIRLIVRKCKRPSDFLRALSMVDRIKLLSYVGGITTLTCIAKIVKLLYARLVSEGADYVRPEVNEVTEKQANEFWDEHERYKRFTFNPKIEGTARSTTPEQLIGMVKKRLMMIHIKTNTGSTRFCNCIPVRGNMMLLPAHVVPNYNAEALITKANTNPKKVIINMNSCYKIPSTDFCLWYVPELGDQRDLTEYFPGKISHGKQLVGDMIYNDHGEIKMYNKILGTRGTSRTTLGGLFESLTYYFPNQTFQGLCMATFVAKDNRDMPFIGGFHLGGKNCTAAAGFLTREQLLSAIEVIAQKPSVLPSHAGQAFETKLGGVDVGPLEKPHTMCVTNNLDSDARCVIFGAHNKPGATPSSQVVTSSISEKVTEHLNLEKMHDKPHKMKDIMHKEVDIDNKVNTAFRFDSALIDKAVIDFDITLNQKLKGKLNRLGKLEDDIVLAGLDGVVGINAMNFNTACGFPLSGPKTQFVTISDRKVEGVSCPRDIDQDIIIEIKKLEQTLLNGNRINTVFKASLKDEPTKIGKKKVRVFAGCNIYFIMLVRKYFLSISALMQDNKDTFECAVGLNVESPEWTSMMKKVYKHGINRVVAGDYKSFDGRMSPRFMLASFKILINLAEVSGNYDADDLTIMRGIATEICSPTYDYFGTLVQFCGSNPSGHPLTVVTNSLVNSLYMRYVYYHISAEERWWRTPLYSDVVSLMTYGDDNIMSVKEGYDSYNHTNIARVLALSDITYTMADKEAKSVPFIHGSEAGFLKHDAVWNEELQLYRAKIDESSICKMLHAHGKSQITEELHAACTIKDALDKYAHYGKEQYTLRCEQLKLVAEECNLTGLVGSFPTYQEQILKYCEKYTWDENPYPPVKQQVE
jgi:hypothetical protein